MMDILREKIARVACEVDCGRMTENELARCRDIADAILAIPELKEALASREVVRRSRKNIDEFKGDWSVTYGKPFTLPNR